MTLPLEPDTYERVYSRGTKYWEPRSGVIQSIGFKQKAPFDVPTRCERNYFQVNSVIGRDYLDGRNIGFYVPTALSWLATEASNKAYERLVGKLGDSSSFGATLTAERRETWGMVVGTIERLVRAARHVRKLELGSAARELGVPYSERVVKATVGKGRRRRKIKRVLHRLPNGREVQKSLASGWLMYSYGVKPLAEDIYNGMDVLQRPLEWDTIRGSGRAEWSGTYRQNSSLGPNYWQFQTYSYKVSCRMSCQVTVKNPNLWLANRLGLINPVQWVNEAIPLSFVADWFSNLSTVIGSMTDFVGLDVKAPCTTYLYTANVQQGWVGSDAGPVLTTLTDITHRTFKRELSLVMPKLSFGYERFSWQRGLNAISLLVGFLPSKK